MRLAGGNIGVAAPSEEPVQARLAYGGTPALGELTAYLDVPLGLQAPAAARRAVRSMLASWGFANVRWLDQASVVVNELVASAMRHGGSCLELRLSADDGQVMVSVADGSAVVPRRRDPDDAGGRGLALIEALTQRWGAEPFEGGKRVWAILAPYPGADPTT